MSMATRTTERKAPKVWNASYCDMYGTVSIIENTIQFLSDAGEVLTIDLPSWRQHGECYGEIGLANTQAMVDRIRFHAEKAMVVAGNALERTPPPQSATTRECANCMKRCPRNELIYRKSQYFCLPCEAEQRQVA